MPVKLTPRQAGKLAEKRDLFRTKRIPNSLAKMIHLERLADDAHIRALDRKAKKKAESMGLNLPAKLRARAITAMRPGDSTTPKARQDPALTFCVIETDLRVTNPMNSTRSKNWRPQAAERKRIREGTTARIMDEGEIPALPVTVQLHRMGKGLMDEWDGLPASLKPVVDGIADAYGLPDHDPRFTWLKPTQERAKTYGVRITIEARRES